MRHGGPVDEYHDHDSTFMCLFWIQMVVHLHIPLIAGEVTTYTIRNTDMLACISRGLLENNPLGSCGGGKGVVVWVMDEYLMCIS